MAVFFHYKGGEGMALNQYDRGSKNNGPNAHKKGNRTNSRRDADYIAAFSRQQSADIAAYKEQAEKRRKARKYKQEDLTGIMQRLNDYIEAQRDSERPLTVSGMIRAAGVSKATWYEMLGGNYDYLLIQYADYHSIPIDQLNDANGAVIHTVTDDEDNEIMLIPYSEALQKAVLAVEEQTEERLYSKGRVGDIFSLKALHGWQEDQTPQTVNQTLVIATEEQARKAIDLLK